MPVSQQCQKSGSGSLTPKGRGVLNVNRKLFISLTLTYRYRYRYMCTTTTTTEDIRCLTVCLYLPFLLFSRGSRTYLFYCLEGT